MVCSRGESITTHRNQMKLIKTLAATAAVITCCLGNPPPAEANAMLECQMWKQAVRMKCIRDYKKAQKLEANANHKSPVNSPATSYLPQITRNPVNNKSNAAGHSGTTGGNGTNVNGQGNVVSTNQVIHIHHHHYTRNTTQNNTNFSNGIH